MQDAAPTTRTGGTGGSLPCTASGGPCLLCLSGVLIEGQQSDIRTEGLVPLWSVACNLLCLSASSEKSALRARGLFVSCICGRRGRDCAAWAGMRQLLRRGRSARMPNAKDAPTKGQAESCCTGPSKPHASRAARCLLAVASCKAGHRAKMVNSASRCAAVANWCAWASQAEAADGEGVRSLKKAPLSAAMWALLLVGARRP
mmetsp:Transcript_10513/g.28779  ORF Transcript_10513/g.28779 Transcript_10513/m.28779 type:complete len:202 (-) Transcript_10513:377-982(-)